MGSETSREFQSQSSELGRALTGGCTEARKAVDCCGPGEGLGQVNSARNSLVNKSSFQDPSFDTQKPPMPDSDDGSTGSRFGLGILWLTRNNKLIVAGFAPGSAAKMAGVKSGDILKSVNGIEVLNMVVDSRTGKHQAGEFMLGSHGSNCDIVLLRVPQESQGAADQNPTKISLQQVKCKIPRLLAAEDFSTQNF